MLWEVLAELVSENKDFGNKLEIKLAGKVDLKVMEAIEKNQLKKYLNKIEYLPHNEVIHEQQRSQVLLLILNNTPNAKGILTGKLFEYLAAQRPVICIGPEDGDAAKIVEATKSGFTCDFNNKQKLKEIIITMFTQYISGELKLNSRGFEKYSRRNLTNELSQLLNSISQLH